jgi:signal transduction protein with GAF and PtsI domain
VVSLWDDGQLLLVPTVWHGLPGCVQQVRLRLDEGLEGTVARRRQGMIVNNYRSSPYFQPTYAQQLNRPAIIAQPLLYWDRLLGVSSVNNQGMERLFTEQDYWQRLAFGPGLISSVVASHRTMRTMTYVDASRREGVEPMPSSLPFPYWLGVPITLNHTLLAVLTLLDRQPIQIRADNQTPLNSLVAQAAVALRNTRLFTESEERWRAAESLAVAVLYRIAVACATLEAGRGYPVLIVCRLTKEVVP